MNIIHILPIFLLAVSTAGLSVYSEEAFGEIKRQVVQVNQQLPVIELNAHHCQPTLTAVKVPTNIVLPTYVKLPRCMGACAHDDWLTCTVLTEKKFLLKVMDVYGNVESGILMTNHTSCDCACRPELDNCNPATHTFDNNTCGCVCKNRACASPKKKLDFPTCQCECRDNPRVCTGYESKKTWSYNTCQCECNASDVRKCNAKGKSMKVDTCQCVKIMV